MSWEHGEQLCLRFVSMYGTLFGYLLLLILSWDLFAIALDHTHSPIISCNDLWSCILGRSVLFLGSVAGVTYRKSITFDRLTQQVREKATIFGWWTLYDNAYDMKKFTAVSMRWRREETSWRLKGSRNYIMADFCLLELVGGERRPFLIKKYGAAFFAKRHGRRIAQFMGLPFADATDRGSAEAFQVTRDDQPTVITRKDVEEVLLKWQEGRWTVEQVEEWSNDHHPDEGVRYADTHGEEWDRSAISAVLVELDNLSTQQLTISDIPIFLEFLRSAPETFDEAYAQFNKALKQIGQERRR